MHPLNDPVIKYSGFYRRTRLHTAFLWHNNPKTAKECQLWQKHGYR